jgi:hypothetical protein
MTRILLWNRNESLPATRLLTISRRFVLTLEKRSSVVAFGKLGLHSSSRWSACLALDAQAGSWSTEISSARKFSFCAAAVTPPSLPSALQSLAEQDPMTFKHQLDSIVNIDVASSIVFHCCCQKFTASTTYIPKQNDNHVPSYSVPSYSSTCPGSQLADLTVAAPACLMWLLRLARHSLVVVALLFIGLY